MSVLSLKYLRKLENVFDSHRKGFFRTENTVARQILTEKGDAFIVSDNVQGFADGSTRYYAVKSASSEPTIVNFNMNVSGKVRVKFFEGSTVSGGSELSEENLNRESNAGDASDVVVEAGVSHDSVGDELLTGGAGGGSSNPSQQTIPATLVGNPWILATDTTYVYEVTNVSGASIDLNPTLGYTVRGL